MKDLELSKRGKAAYAGLCVACCGFPMLIVLGFLSIGAAVSIGVSIAAALAIAVLAYLVTKGKTGHVPTMLPRMLAASGMALAVAGLWLVSSANASMLSASVALLAAAALLVLVDAETASV